VNKFFVPNKIYEDRIAICRGCKFYVSLLGNCSICKCFMKVKARISNQYCPQKYWDKTKEVETTEELPQEMITELLYVGKKLIKGRFKNHEIKVKAITLYNTIYMTNYNTRTNCGSCLATCYDGITKLYKKYNK